MPPNWYVTLLSSVADLFECQGQKKGKNNIKLFVQELGNAKKFFLLLLPVKYVKVTLKGFFLLKCKLEEFSVHFNLFKNMY